MGTPDYISPEQAQESHTVDIRADIYSLGCTLYFLLTGQVPFPDSALTEKLLKHLLEEPTPVEEFRGDVPGEVLAVIRKMMAKKPEDRFQTPRAVAEALKGVASLEGGGTVELRKPSAPAKSLPSAIEAETARLERRAAEERLRRKKLQIRIAVALVGLVLGGVVVAFLLRDNPPAPPPQKDIAGKTKPQ
jgi:serine/threonine protein kinase